MISVQEYAEFIKKEKVKLVSKWKDAGLFNNVSEALLDISVMLDNTQRDSVGLFRRLSVPLTYRIFDSLIIRNLVSVQPVINKETKYLYFDDINDAQAEIKAKDVSLEKRLLNNTLKYSEYDAVRLYSGVAGESKFAAELAAKIAIELNRSVISDLSNNAKYSSSWKYNEEITFEQNRETLSKLIWQAAEVIGDMNNRGPANWMIVPPDVYLLLEKEIKVNEKYGLDELFYVGKFNDIAVYEDLLATNEILLGYFGDNIYDSGYFYIPKHVALRGSDISLYEESAREWYSNGSSFYGKILISSNIMFDEHAFLI
jgi:Major capsid protein Gp23